MSHSNSLTSLVVISKIEAFISEDILSQEALASYTLQVERKIDFSKNQVISNLSLKPKEASHTIKNTHLTLSIQKVSQKNDVQLAFLLKLTTPTQKSESLIVITSDESLTQEAKKITEQIRGIMLETSEKSKATA